LVLSFDLLEGLRQLFSQLFAIISLLQIGNHLLALLEGKVAALRLGLDHLDLCVAVSKLEFDGILEIMLVISAVTSGARNTWSSESHVDANFEADVIRPLLEIGCDEIIIWVIGESDLHGLVVEEEAFVTSGHVGYIEEWKRGGSWISLHQLDGLDVGEIEG